MIDQGSYDVFNSSLLSLHDDRYFALLKGFLGTISTPFNKHQLNRTLASILTRSEHQNGIVNHLNSTERQLLTTLSIMHSIREQELLYLCTGCHEYHECLHGALLLEQKLIVIPDPALSHQIIINPLFRENLSGIIDYRSLFSVEREDALRIEFSADVHLIFRALVSIAIHEDPKKVELPAQWEVHKPFFGNLLMHLRNRLKVEGITSVTETSEDSVAWMLLSGGFSQNPFAENIGLFLSALKTFSETFEVRGEAGSLTLVRFAQSLAHLKEIETDTLRSLLFSLSILAEKDTRDKDVSGTEDTIDSDHSITIHRGNPLSYTGRYHLYSRLSGLDTTIRYTVDKQSLFKAFSRSLSPQEIIDDMRHYSTRVPPSIVSLIPLLHQEYSQVMQIEGVILKTDARMERIFDAHTALAPFIVMKIADGIYVMNQNQEVQWRKVLSDIGVQHIASQGVLKEYPEETRTAPVHPLPAITLDLPYPVAAASMKMPAHVTDIRPSLYESLNRKQFSEEVKALLRARIEDFIIISEQQLHATGEEQKILSASGLDYMKKLRVIRAAMKEPTFHLLVVIFDQEGNTQEYIGTPLSLTRKDEEDVLLMKTHPDEKEHHWKVKSLYRVKTVPLSIFFVDKRNG
ncbi:MAG: hypothetical protein JXK93_01215 [Sphaerochaetaceae bacterium]|nr:hypothetical protein [Sphaerochaetaceae bacterium]